MTVGSAGSSAGSNAGSTVRSRVLAGAYQCIARFGMAKTTVDDVVKASGVSRATIYRYFPGGRDQLLRETVGWEMDRFFVRLAEAVAAATDFAAMVEEGLVFARHAVLEHVVLQKMLETEPETLLPLLTIESHRVLPFVVASLRPFLEREAAAGRLRPGVDVAEASEYVGRMLLALIANPGSVDFDDPGQVRSLVRRELLGGVLVDP